MNFVKTTLSICIIFLFFIAGIGCSGVKNMSFTKEGGQIPPDFGDPNDTLLVIKAAPWSDENTRLKKSFRKLYTGNYKMIKGDELNKYPASTYRYIFELGSARSYTITDASGRAKSGSTVECIITDRTTGKLYKSGNTTFYGKLLKAFVPELSKAIQK